MGEDRVSNELSTKLTVIHVSWRQTPLIIPIFFIYVTSKSVKSKTKKQNKTKKPEENIEFILKQPCQPCILCLLYIFVVKFNYSV